MTLRKLASEIAKREGKKSQARIGDIREILGILSDIYVEDTAWDMALVFAEAGFTRIKRKRKGPAKASPKKTI
jgi:hypothetical protein